MKDIKHNGYTAENMLEFYNFNTGNIQPHIWNELQSGLWKQFDIDAYLHNNIIPSEQIHDIQPIFPNIQQIIPGTKWNFKDNHLEQDYYYPNKVSNCSLTNLLDAVASYLDSLNYNKIGVHLSGGLDSTLIMALLRELDVPFVPIGLKSNTFEFRTERFIQDIVFNWGIDGLLIDIEEYPHYSQLDKLPPHQIPDSDIKSVAGANAIADAFRERECDLVFTGLGGDSLFVDAIDSVENVRFNINNEFLNPTENQRVYSPREIKLESLFAHKPIIDIICSAREGQRVDCLKQWLRKWASPILPVELSKYSYFADFFGLSMWGLECAKPTIKLLMEESFDLTHSHHFSNKSINQFLKQDVFSFEYTDYIMYCGLISVATWFHSLLSNK